MPSSSVIALLNRIGLTPEDNLLNRANEHQGTTYGAVYMGLWRAFDSFESAEQEYQGALISLAQYVEAEQKSVLAGNAGNSRWIGSYAEKVTSAAADMASAVKTIMSLNSVLRTL